MAMTGKPAASLAAVPGRPAGDDRDGAAPRARGLQPTKSAASSTRGNQMVALQEVVDTFGTLPIIGDTLSA
jgi:hypothetical protein